MIIPCGTDAPIYHRPIGTIALIVSNVAFHIYFLMHEGGARYELSIGDGIHVPQWGH
jgi:hypothetical protein